MCWIKNIFNKVKIGKNDIMDIGNNKNNKWKIKGDYYEKNYQELYFQEQQKNIKLESEIQKLKDEKDYISKKVIFLHSNWNDAYLKFIKLIIENKLNCLIDKNIIKISKNDFSEFIELSKKDDFIVYCLDYPDCQDIEPSCPCTTECVFKFE